MYLILAGYQGVWNGGIYGKTPLCHAPQFSVGTINIAASSIVDSSINNFSWAFKKIIKVLAFLQV